MKRHPALRDLSRDHLFALRIAHHIDQAHRRIANGPTPEAAAAQLGRAWPDDLVWHFREEEEVLLPLLARHVEPTTLPEVRRMLDDHAYLRDAVGRLDWADPDEELLATIGTRLHDHVRHEERRLYPLLEELLDPAELDELARESEAFRRRWRSEDVIGPFRSHG